LNQIHYHIRQVQKGGKLYRAVKIYNLCFYSLFQKELPGDLGILGGNPQKGCLFVLPKPFLLSRNDQPTKTYAKVVKLIDFGLSLQQHIITHHSQIRHAVFHIHGHIKGLYQKELVVAHPNLKPSSLLKGLLKDALAFKKFQGLLKEPAFG
jgi:hypothetical protein